MCQKLNKPNTKQKSFILEYLIDKNATQAAIRAGYATKNAHVTGPRMLSNVSIKVELSRQIALQEKRTLITADQVITELKKIAFLDIRGAFTEQGMLRDLSDIPEDIAHAMAGIECIELYDSKGGDRAKIGYTKKIKLSNKVCALELLGKHLKIFTEKIEHSGMLSVHFDKQDAKL